MPQEKLSMMRRLLSSVDATPRLASPNSKSSLSKAIRVTEVLDYFAEPWKLDWYAKNGKAHCNRVSKAAMKIGTIVDETLKLASRDDKFPVCVPVKHKTIEVSNCLVAYNKWLGIYQPKKVTPCVRLYKTIGDVEVTGEPDIKVDEVLVDIKCANKISLKHWIQVNMYQRLLLETKLPDTTYVVGILRLDKKTGSYEYVIKKYDPRLVDVWCGMLKAYVAFKGDSDDSSDE